MQLAKQLSRPGPGYISLIIDHDARGNTNVAISRSSYSDQPITSLIRLSLLMFSFQGKALSRDSPTTKRDNRVVYESDVDGRTRVHSSTQCAAPVAMTLGLSNLPTSSSTSFALCTYKFRSRIPDSKLWVQCLKPREPSKKAASTYLPPRQLQKCYE